MSDVYWNNTHYKTTATNNANTKSEDTMTHYSENPNMVRVDYWTESGKWYMTEAVDMNAGYDVPLVHVAVELAMNDHWEKTRSTERRRAWNQFTITIAEPYHMSEYPVMIKANTV